MSRARNKHRYTLLCATREEMHDQIKPILWAVEHNQVPGHDTDETRLRDLYLMYVCMFDPYMAGRAKYKTHWSWCPTGHWIRIHETVIVLPRRSNDD